jgi:hypothetical protein
VRRRLGGWTLPSGRTVDAYLGGMALSASRTLEFEWSAPPPLTPADRLYYEKVILPVATQRIQQLIERPGRALLVQAGS